MIERFGKVFLVCLLGVILFTGCNDKTNDDLNDDMNSGINDNNENNNDNVGNDDNNQDSEDNIPINRTWMVSLTGYLDSDNEYSNRYYGFNKDSGARTTKEFDLNGKKYKFDVEVKTLNNKLEYNIYFNNELLDTITSKVVLPENKFVDLFVLDGYAVIGYNHSYINVYDLNNNKLVDSFTIVSNFTSIVNEFVLTNDSLSFVDVSGCPVKKVTVKVNNNEIDILKETMTRDELDKYELSGGAC